MQIFIMTLARGKMHIFMKNWPDVSDWIGAEPNNDKASRSRYQQERTGEGASIRVALPGE